MLLGPKEPITFSLNSDVFLKKQQMHSFMATLAVIMVKG